jgi:hypothetical protein
MATRLNALVDRAAGAAFGLTNYANLEADVNYLLVAGADLASAATINITAAFHGVTGVTTIDNITDALGAVAGQHVRLWIKGGPLTIRHNGGGTGNIRTLTGVERVAAPNETIEFIYDSAAAVWREAQPSVGLVKLWDSVDAGVTLPTASITTPTLPSTFKHLILEWSARTDGVVTDDIIGVRLNSDSTASHYTALGITSVSAGAPAADDRRAQTVGFFGWAAGASAGGQAFGGGRVEFPNYTSTVVRKPFTSVGFANYGFPCRKRSRLHLWRLLGQPRRDRDDDVPGGVGRPLPDRYSLHDLRSSGMSNRLMVNLYEVIDGVETLVHREMNDDEHAQLEIDQADFAARSVADGRDEAARAIRARLAESDVWAIRHVEDGASLTPERIAYRKQLRTLLGSVASSDDPLSIKIPDPPPPPAA